MLCRVFISYSTKDLEIVNKIKEQLKREEVEVFIAEYSIEPGEELNKRIVEEIKNCDLFILIWSKNSRNSEYVNQEIGMAKCANKTIIPISTKKGLNPPVLINDLKYLNINNSVKEISDFINSKIATKIKQKNTNNLIFLGIITLIISILSNN